VLYWIAGIFYVVQVVGIVRSSGHTAAEASRT
jgi:hypothetical protein